MHRHFAFLVHRMEERRGNARKRKSEERASMQEVLLRLVHDSIDDIQEETENRSGYRRV